MEAQMKSMNTVMPIMSAVFCFTLPVGIGIYWIAGAVVRSVQQVIINRSLEKEDMEDIIKKNQAKAAKRRKKKGFEPNKITTEASKNVRRLDIDRKLADNTAKDNRSLTTSAPSNVRPGSLADKANLVARLDERNGKKR